MGGAIETCSLKRDKSAITWSTTYRHSDSLTSTNTYLPTHVCLATVRRTKTALGLTQETNIQIF